MTSTRPFRAAAAIATAAAIAAAGCDRGAPGLSLDREVALASTEKFLEAWKSGATPDTLKSGDPEIIVGDPDFDAGKPLAGYRLMPGESDDGTNLHLIVELEVAEKKGAAPRKKRVTYVVGTSPVITIFPR